MFANNFTLIKKGNYNAWSKSRAFSKYKNTGAPSYNESIVIDDLNGVHISVIQDTNEGNSKHQLNPNNFNGLINYKLDPNEIYEQEESAPEIESTELYVCPSSFPKSATITFSDHTIDPAEVTWSEHGLVPGTPIKFARLTGSTNPGGLSTSTTYYVATVLDINTFTFSADISDLDPEVDFTSNGNGTYSCTTQDNISYAYPDDVLKIKNAFLGRQNNPMGRVTAMAIHPRTGDIYVAFHSECAMETGFYGNVSGIAAVANSARINVYDHVTKELKRSQFFGGAISSIVIDPNEKLWIMQSTNSTYTVDVPLGGMVRILVVNTTSFAVEHYLFSSYADASETTLRSFHERGSTDQTDSYMLLLDESQGIVWASVWLSQAGTTFYRVVGYEYNNITKNIATLDKLEFTTSGLAQYAVGVDLVTVNTNNTITQWNANNIVVPGDKVRIIDYTTLPSPLVANTSYYVREVLSTTSFTLSETNGGAEIDITSAGSSVILINEKIVPSWIYNNRIIPAVSLTSSTNTFETDAVGYSSGSSGFSIKRAPSGKTWFTSSGGRYGNYIVDLVAYPYGTGGDTTHADGLIHTELHTRSGSNSIYDLNGTLILDGITNSFDIENGHVYSFKSSPNDRFLKLDIETGLVLTETIVPTAYNSYRFGKGKTTIDNCGQLWTNSLLVRINEDPPTFAPIFDTLTLKNLGDITSLGSSVTQSSGYQVHPKTGDIYLLINDTNHIITQYAAHDTIRIIRNDGSFSTPIPPKQQLSCNVISVYSASSLADDVGVRYNKLEEACTYINSQPDNTLWVIKLYGKFGTSYTDTAKINGNRKVIIKGMNPVFHANCIGNINVDSITNVAATITASGTTAINLNNVTFAAGQSFLTSTSFVDSLNYHKVRLRLKKTGSPTGTAVLNIYAHSGTPGTSSIPTGSPLLTSVALDVSTLTTSYEYYEFHFNTALSITPNTNFVFALEYTNGTAVNYVTVLKRSSFSATINSSTFDGVTWTPNADDLVSAVFGISNNSDSILILENSRMNPSILSTDNPGPSQIEDSHINISSMGGYILLNKVFASSTADQHIIYDYTNTEPVEQSIVSIYNSAIEERISYANGPGEIKNKNNPASPFKLILSNSSFETDDITNVDPIESDTGYMPVIEGTTLIGATRPSIFTSDDFFYIDSANNVYIFNSAPTALKTKLDPFII